MNPPEEIRHNAIDFAFRFSSKGKAVEEVIRDAQKIADFIANEPGPAKIAPEATA